MHTFSTGAPAPVASARCPHLCSQVLVAPSVRRCCGLGRNTAERLSENCTRKSCDIIRTQAGFGKASSTSKKSKKQPTDTHEGRKHEDDLPCACGSRRLYKDCCREFHQGAWAPTALDLCRARFSACILGLESFLLETTDSDSPECKGIGRRISGDQLMRLRAFGQSRAVMLDVAHGALTEDAIAQYSESFSKQNQPPPDPWFVVFVFQPTLENVLQENSPQAESEVYSKRDGRWYFWSFERCILPLNESFEALSAKWKLWGNGEEEHGEGEDEGYKYDKDSYGAAGIDASDDPEICLGRYAFTAGLPRPQAADREALVVDMWTPEELEATSVKGYVFMKDSKDTQKKVKSDKDAKESFRKSMDSVGYEQQEYRWRLYV